MSLRTHVSRFNRSWTCSICGMRKYVSRRKHFQTGQPLTNAEQIASLTYLATEHWRQFHVAASPPRTERPDPQEQK